MLKTLKFIIDSTQNRLIASTDCKKNCHNVATKSSYGALNISLHIFVYKHNHNEAQIP